MGLFEFLMVLVSIIVGLGVTKVLGGVADSLRARDSIRGYWVHRVLVACIFVALLQQWWETWGLRDSAEWSFAALLVLLGAPVCLFLMSDLVFPEPVEDSDMRAYYYDKMRPLWILGMIAVTTSTAFRPIFFGQPLIDPSNSTSVIGFIGFWFLFRSSRHALHALVVPTFFVLLVLDILVWTPIIGT